MAYEPFEPALPIPVNFSVQDNKYEGKEKYPKKDRTPVSTQNLTVVAKDAILKADTRERLDLCAESLEVRYANRQIPQNDYNDLCDLIKTRKEVIKT